MDKFIDILRNIRDVLYPEIVAKYNMIIGINPLGLDGKVDKITGKGLSTNDYTTPEKSKLAAIDMSLVEMLANKGMPSGYVPLDAAGKINPQYLSSLSVIDVYTPVDQASMLALTQASLGDIAFRQDNQNSYQLVAQPASTLSNWKQLNMVGVSSINGKIGIVNIGTDDIPEGMINQYFTNERVDDRVAALLQAGANVSIVYDDVANTLTISADDLSVNWDQLQSKPTTILGYGITDAYTKTEIDGSTTIVHQDSDTGVAYMPDGTTAQRPTLPNGQSGIRRNTETGKFEGGIGTAGATQWGSLGGGATGGGSDEVFNLNSYTITTSYTIPAGKSAVVVANSDGDVVFASTGIEITFADTKSRLVVL